MKKTRAPLTLIPSLLTLFAFALAQQPAQTPAPAQQPAQSQTPATPSQPLQAQPSPLATPRAETPAAQPSPPAEFGEDEVVRITTNLVQLDVVVTDKSGKQVTDLKPEDFQVLEDGRPQKVTNFSYVSTDSPTGDGLAAATPAPKPDKNGVPAPAPPRRLRPEQVRRTIALVVDDLEIPFEDIYFVRRAIRKYIDKYLGENDLVAVMRTSAGAGATQQFTSDRRLLYAEVERIRPYLPNGQMGVFAPVQNNNNRAGIGSTSMPGRGGSNAAGDTGDADAGGPADTSGATTSTGSKQRDEADDFHEEYFTVGTLGALRYLINGMHELPGRKSIILFTPGFRLLNTDRDSAEFGSDRALVAARHVTDLANRASVIIYTIDPRGLVNPGMSARDDMTNMSPQQMNELMSQRSAMLFETQGGSDVLAEQTGGIAFKNSNEMLPADRILEDLRGYYLIGYRPAGETFNRRYHTITARLLNHPELRVRARKGFYGVPSEEMPRSGRRTRDQQFIAALLSPVASGAVGVQLTALFTNTEKVGSVVSAQLHVNAHDLQFARQPDGKYQAKLDLVGVTFNDTGVPIDQRGITQTLNLPEDAYQRALRAGILYTVNVPVKKPGAYQLRVALRDDTSEKIGSASQFIEVPDLKKNRLALSGVVVSGAPPQKAAGAEAAAQAAGGREGEVETLDPQSSPAVRKFRARQTIDYACMIFNARADKASPKPRLTARVMLYRDGEAVFSGSERPVSPEQPDPRRLVYAGRLTLGSNLAPGEYALQVVVTDQLRTDKYRTASQWIDFEIVK